MRGIQDIFGLLEQHGRQRHGPAGHTLLQHAWQCGRLARRAKVPPALQLAAWLHDLGHLLTPPGRADRHEQHAAELLQPLFGPAVSEPIILHVQAKRYLVGARRGYERVLSPMARHRLDWQGGPMSAEERSRFLDLPHATDALRLRTWDDAAHLEDWRPSSVASALDELRRLMDEFHPTH
jgi:predicted HD phosphohydrolase